MKSAHSKVTHRILGKSLVEWAVRAAKSAGIGRVVVVVGHAADEVRALFEGTDVELVEQKERKGTGHAVATVLDQTTIDEDCVVILSGDSPLVRPATIESLAAKVTDEKKDACVLTMTPADVTGYGRVVISETGEVEAIIEHKDATEKQREELRECNSGVYAFNARALAEHIGELSSDNAQGEYYLTDMVAIIKNAGCAVVHTHVADDTEMLGVNSRAQLAEATKVMQLRINEELMAGGVTMIDPNLVWAEPDVEIGRDTVVLPMTFLSGSTKIGENCLVGPNTRLTDVTVANDCVVDETVAIEAVLDEGVHTGPRAYLRPGTHMCAGSKAGTHVEIKNSTIGEGSKVPHLSYIGDTTMGRDVNIGAGSITCNYDGEKKWPTTIGDNAFVGSDTMMVAPVKIGERALVGASSCITRDVPAGALALERSEQIVIEGYRSE
jgi:bifunctional UDP-N-acetylglucosamine pyrophosphorylase/glucosamine-1-phosphate N-acetyltransferase